MTEQEWLASIDIYEMFLMVEDDRKKQLFAVACCRKVWGLLIDDRSKEAVEALEGFADGLVDKKVLVDACRAANAVPDHDGLHYYAADAICYAGNNFYKGDYHLANVAYIANLAVRANYYNLLRNLANPYYKPTYNPSNQARNLANVIYKNKDWQALSILADLLEEEGCTDTSLLSHLRTKEEVYRGWWSLDFVRGV